MISLSSQDRKFYSENAPALISYMRYVEYILQNKEKFGGDENVELALRIGKFIGRNEIEQSEVEQIKEGIKKFLKSNPKVENVIAILKNKEKLDILIKKVIGSNPKAFLIVSPNGEVLKDAKGNYVPNIMKISLVLANELKGED